MRFDAGYQEQTVLRDGTHALLRCIRPEDKTLLREGFERLSPESRYRRFLGAKRSLSAAELRYLTEVDGTMHFAIGARRLDGEGPAEGLGIARFVRQAEQPEVAEAAVAVIDPMQGQGLGTLLLRRLVEAAVERGVERFRCVVLASNDPMRHVLEGLGLEVLESHDGDVLLVDTPLPSSVEALAALDTTAEHGAPIDPFRRALDSLGRILRLAAEGLLAIRGRVAALGGLDSDHPPPEPGPAPEEEPTGGGER